MYEQLISNLKQIWCFKTLFHWLHWALNARDVKERTSVTGVGILFPFFLSPTVQYHWEPCFSLLWQIWKFLCYCCFCVCVGFVGLVSFFVLVLGFWFLVALGFVSFLFGWVLVFGCLLFFFNHGMSHGHLKSNKFPESGSLVYFQLWWPTEGYFFF